MTALHEATRETRKLGERRKGARYAFAVFEGIVREVYEIETSESTDKSVCATSKRKLDRWELTGRPADESIRSEYVGRSVAAYFRRGQQMPTVYVNC